MNDIQNEIYKTHKIWTVVNITVSGNWYFELFDLKEKRNTQIDTKDEYFPSPDEAYQKAYEFVTKELKNEQDTINQ